MLGSLMSSSSPQTQREVVGLHVKFTINTPDGLRRVIFDLDKTNGDGGAVTWKIAFTLFERQQNTDPYTDPIVDLSVEVDTALSPNAQTMADNGMTPTQAAFASGPAADIAKDPTVDDATKQTTVQTTLNR
jgi:hypothetical protein